MAVVHGRLLSQRMVVMQGVNGKLYHCAPLVHHRVRPLSPSAAMVRQFGNWKDLLGTKQRFKIQSPSLCFRGQEAEEGFKSGCKDGHWRLDEQLRDRIRRLQNGWRTVGGGQRRLGWDEVSPASPSRRMPARPCLPVWAVLLVMEA